MPYTRRFKILYPAVLGLAAALSLGAAASALAAEPPVAVSPGSASGTVIGDACPAFSWGVVSGAESYDVVVYRVEDERAAAEPVLRETFAGSATSWTPSLDRCLEQGGQYAWSVRAVSGDKASAWSPPSLFEVAGGPSEVEFEGALEIVRQFLAVERGAQAAGAAEEDLEGEVSTSSAGPAAVGTTQLSVDGGVAATSFTGDGSTLTALNPANLSAAVPLAQGGTGATDAMAARTNLEVVAGPHTINTTCDGVACDGSLLANVTAEDVSCIGCVTSNSLAGDSVDAASIAPGAVGTAALATITPVYVDGAKPLLSEVCAVGERPFAVICTNVQESSTILPAPTSFECGGVVGACERAGFPFSAGDEIEVYCDMDQAGQQDAIVFCLSGP